LKVVEFPLNIHQFLLQPKLDWSARLNAAPSEAQESTDFAALKSECLHAANECESFDIILLILTEPAFASCRFPKKRISFVEADCINGEVCPLCDDPHLHLVASL